MAKLKHSEGNQRGGFMAKKPPYDELERKIREMKAVEAELRQSEKKYQKLVETLNTKNHPS